MSTLEETMAEVDRYLRFDAARKELDLARTRLDEVVCQRIAARAKTLAPNAATLCFAVEHDGAGDFLNATAIEDAEGNTLVDLLADLELEKQFRGDLETLLELNPDRPDGFFDLGEPPALPEEIEVSVARRQLADAEVAFAASGGRGIETAERIDALLTAIGVATADRSALEDIVWPYRDSEPEGRYLFDLVTDVLEAVAESEAGSGVDPVPLMLDELDSLIEVAKQVQDRLAGMRLRVVPDTRLTCAICGEPVGADYHIAGAIPEGESDVVGECCWDERLR